MDLKAFVSIAGFLGAIMILRTTQWDQYRHESNVRSVGLGLIWTYSTVAVGIVAIALAALSAVFHNEGDSVPAIPLGYLFLMIFMAMVEIIAVLFSHISKLVVDKPFDQSWLKWLDQSPRLKRLSVLALIFLILAMIAVTGFISYVYS